MSIENDPAAPVGDSTETRAGLSRRTIMKGAAWTVPALMVATSAPMAAASCWPGGTIFNSHGLGKFLSGTIGNQNLDLLASINAAKADTPGPATPQHVVDFNSLDVSVLSAINVDLSGTGALLSDLLGFLVPANTGVYNQYAMADSNGQSIGASGLVSNNGVIDTGAAAGNVDVGSLDLKVILESLVGSSLGGALSNVSDLKLKVGAVGGRAFVDNTNCTPGNDDIVTRDYLLAYLRLLIKSNVVGALSTALNTALSNLTISTSAVWALLEGVPLLGTLLSTLGQNALNVSVSVNTSGLTGPIPTASGKALQINLQQGELLLDLGALLGGAYTGNVTPFLNNLPANTRLFVDAGLPVNALSDTLSAWVDSLIEALKPLITITISAGSVTGPLATGLLIQGSLGDFLGGTATAQFKLLGGTINLGGLLNPLVGGIGNLVIDAVKALFAPTGVLNSVWAPVSALLSGIFGILQNILVLTVNAQNAPTNGGGRPIPLPLQGLPLGRYDVAALHLGLVQTALLNLLLARGSVGPNRPR
ncbi:choice-of-anchor G family protein [Microbacterium sp. USTB-Y]|uniref:choice-of-anchor G family protein n=1 Tax=Microbacterium sp. USTB-Y TaxID=2823692 RepID=UPI00203BA054|nr:choice-of-anchor G family protein [Microbacterium sp. USTB-Y]